MRIKRQLLAALLVVALAGCAGNAAETVWDDRYDFAGLNTYDWAPKEAEAGADMPYDALDTAIKRSVEARLAEVGLTRSSTNPSSLVTYYLGIEEVNRITSDYYAWGWGGYWGYGWYGAAGSNVSLYDEGSLTIDILSAGSEPGMVWRGVAKSAFTADSLSGNLDRLVDGIVDAIFKDFPPDPDKGKGGIFGDSAPDSDS